MIDRRNFFNQPVQDDIKTKKHSKERLFKETIT